MASLLSVDAGVRAGLALYGEDGRLRWYRSQNFGTRERLRAGVRSVLSSVPDLGHLALEGGGPVAEFWAREAGERGIPVLRVSAEQWRARLLYQRERRSGPDAKKNADALARRVIQWSGAPRPTSLRHDAAEAILVGLWAVLETGWLAGLPRAVRG
jgi:hypothetical protein